jgi:hypothetical protein
MQNPERLYIFKEHLTWSGTVEVLGCARKP